MPASIYEDPAIYDILHAPGTASEAAGLESTFDRFVKGPARRKTWLEPACGSARLLRALAAKGRPVAGFDLSPAMIAYGERCLSRLKRKHRAHLFTADMTEFAKFLHPNSIGFAFNPINTIRHLPTDRAMQAHFQNIAACLAQGGIYAVGISLSLYGLEAPTEDVWQGRRGHTHVHQFIQYEPPDTNDRSNRDERVTSHLTITRSTRDKKQTTHHDSAYMLRCYSHKQWNNLIAKSPLKAIATCDEEGNDYTPPPFGYAVHILSHR